VKRVIKKYVIPHEGNNHTPHLLRKSGAFGLLIVIVGLFGLSMAQVALIKRTNVAAVLTPILIDLANADRVSEHVSTLAISSVLTKAAQMKADDMAKKGYFAHISPDGLSPWYWFDMAGYSFTYAGENLAVNFTESSDVEAAWMNSPGHRSNILNNKFTEIGIATQNGIYQGQPTIFVVQMFGKPMQTISQASQLKKTFTKNKTPAKNSGSVKSAYISTIENHDMFIAVQNNEPDTIQQVSPDTHTAGTTASAQYAHFIEKAFFMPRQLLEYAYTALSALILLVMSLIMLGEYRRHRFHNMSYGVGLLATMFVLMYVLTTLIPRVVII
jgi:hypothetical protein